MKQDAWMTRYNVRNYNYTVDVFCYSVCIDLYVSRQDLTKEWGEGGGKLSQWKSIHFFITEFCCDVCRYHNMRDRLYKFCGLLQLKLKKRSVLNNVFICWHSLSSTTWLHFPFSAAPTVRWLADITEETGRLQTSRRSFFLEMATLMHF